MDTALVLPLHPGTVDRVCDDTDYVFKRTDGIDNYAQGVTPKTAVLPTGWRKRLVRFQTPGTLGVTALCLEPHDLWFSKAIAGRPKDLEFCKALIKRDLVKPRTLQNRLKEVKKLNPQVRASVSKRIPTP